MHKVGFRDAMTVSRLLDDETAQATLRGRILIVDEAGMISGRQMEGILKLAEREQARILFSGDTRQNHSARVTTTPVFPTPPLPPMVKMTRLEFFVIAGLLDWSA